MKNIYSITKQHYKNFAEQIATSAAGKHYLSDIFSVAEGDVVHRLELSIIIYRDRGSGEVTGISDVWWDCYTIELGEDGDMRLKINNFDFTQLHKQLIGRE